MSAREKVAKAIRANRGWKPKEGVSYTEQLADAAIAAHLEALGQGGYVVVKLPEPQPGWWDAYEEDGDEPDHDAYGEQSAEFFVTTWRAHPGEVQISHQGEPLEPVRPSEARELAAALLAAAAKAEESGTPSDPTPDPLGDVDVAAAEPDDEWPVREVCI